MTQFIFGGVDTEARGGAYPRLVLVGTPVDVFKDSEGLVPAEDMLDGLGDPVETLVIDANSQIPLFSFVSDSQETAWVRVNGGPLSPLHARTDGLVTRVIALEALLSAVIVLNDLNTGV